MQQLEVLQKNIMEATSTDVKSLIEQSLQGQETAYQTLLKLAIKSTFSSDWLEIGDKPYLQQSGTARIALRFGVSVKFDRDTQGNPLIMREDFDDEKYGKGYVYTVCGKAIVGTREFEAIGTASTQDQFLGMEGKGDNRKAVPIHEAMQDAKKKAVTNFYNNAISQIIGIKGMTWEALKEYGVTRGGKGKVAYDTQPKAQEKAPEISKDRPYWTWDNKGTIWFYVKTGNHFSEEWLESQGMKPTKADPSKYGAKYSQTLFEEVEKHFIAYEADQGPY